MPVVLADFTDNPDDVARLGRERAEAHWALHDRLAPRLARESLLVARLDAATEEMVAAIDCTSCGRCCIRMGPELDEATQRRLADVFQLPLAAFRARFLRPMWPSQTDGQRWLLPDPCPLHDGRLCTVYEHRPQVCRDFPGAIGATAAERLHIFVETARICPITFNVMERLRAEV